MKLNVFTVPHFTVSINTPGVQNFQKIFTIYVIMICDTYCSKD